MSLETIQLAQLPNLDGLKVLDLGCGEGRHSISIWIQSRAQVIGMDLSRDDMLTARSRKSDFEVSERDSHSLNFVEASGLNLPFADATFDVVICSEVLEHIPDYAGMLDEIRRVLITGGVFAMSVPRFGPEWVCWKLSTAYHEVPGGHLRIFEENVLNRQIEALGFYKYAKHFAHGLHSPYWWLKCLFWETADDNALVKAYHRLLVWDLMQKPLLTRLLEKILNPFIGKSVAMYYINGERPRAPLKTPNAGLSGE